jgi:hypothetical protein
MALTFHSFKFLQKLQEEVKSMGNVLSVGRMNNLILNDDFKKLSLKKYEDTYADNILLDNFTISSIESLDYSDFEGANIIHDLNLPIIKLGEKFDTILDFGTSEHIFNIIQNFKNISHLCKINGHILHCLPTNNNCGHGFWQFSPELFLNLYQNKNGFDETLIYLVNLHDNENWYEINKQNVGERLELNSSEPLYIFVKTKKIGKISFDNIHQSDYEFHWQKKEGAQNKNKSRLSLVNKRVKDTIKKFLRNNIVSKNYFRKIEDIKNHNKKNFKKNKNLKKIKI